MEKMSFNDFIKYADAYEQYLSMAAPEPKADPEPKAAPEPKTELDPKTEPEPKTEPDWKQVETKLAEVLRRLDKIPAPSLNNIQPESIDDVMKKLFN